MGCNRPILSSLRHGSHLNRNLNESSHSGVIQSLMRPFCTTPAANPMRLRTRPDYKVLHYSFIIEALGVPEELWPRELPKGLKSYTIQHKKHAGSLQVLHKKGMFYLNSDRDGVQPGKPTVSWHHHGDVQTCWIYVKQILKW